MEKIYSRKRMIMPKLNLPQNPNKNKNIKKLVKIIMIVVVAISVATTIINAIEPIINRQCINMARSLSTIISNDEATEIMKKYKYGDFIEIVQDNEGNVKYINSNIISINEVTSDIANNIQNRLNSIEDGEFGIRLGSFTGVKLLSGRGPKVKVKMSTVGSVETNLISEFTSVGINQTLHRIYVEIKCTVAVLTPYSSSEQTIINQVLMAESVIVGTTPSTYYNLEGLKSDDVMEVIN